MVIGYPMGIESFSLGALSCNYAFCSRVLSNQLFLSAYVVGQLKFTVLVYVR